MSVWTERRGNAAPGHTVGHQSLAVETAVGTTVVAADAVPTFRNVDRDAGEPRRLGGALDEVGWWESAAEVPDRGDAISTWRAARCRTGGPGGTSLSRYRT